MAKPDYRLGLGFENAFRKTFSDIKNLVIGILLSILPIIRFFAKGYILETSGVGKRKNVTKLPEWTNWGDLFVKGLLSWAISVLYFLPVIILVLIGAGTFITALAGAYAGSIIPGDAGIGAEDAIGQDIAGAISQQNWIELVPFFIQLAPILIIAGLIALFVLYLVPIAVLNYISTGTFADAFNFSKVFKKAFTGQYLLTWLIVLVITIVLGAALGWIPILGPAAAYFIAGVMGYTLFGEIYYRI